MFNLITNILTVLFILTGIGTILVSIADYSQDLFALGFMLFLAGWWIIFGKMEKAEEDARKK